jgi:hypothetical protein
MAEASVSHPIFPDATLRVPGVRKLDLDAIFALQKSNLAAWREAQDVLLAAAEAISRAQFGYFEETAAEVRSLFSGKAPREPGIVVAQLKTAVDKTVGLTERVIDLGTTAQRRVAELFSSRVAANFDGFKALAAA